MDEPVVATRPEAPFATGDSEIVVSVAYLDMAPLSWSASTSHTRPMYGSV